MLWPGVATARVAEDLKDDHIIFPACGSCKDVEGYIMTLGVAPKCRGRRIGSRLLNGIMHCMMGEVNCDYLTLHMKDGNAAALRLYLSHNFQVVEELPLHYLIKEQKYDAVRLLYRAPQPSSMQWCGPLAPCVRLIQGGAVRILERLYGKSKLVLPL